MPLSEDEQRILAEIEKNLHQSDPDLARTVNRRGWQLARPGGVKLSALALIAGFAIIITTLIYSYWFAFAGFLLALFGAVGLEQNLRSIGRSGIGFVARSIRDNEADDQPQPD